MSRKKIGCAIGTDVLVQFIGQERHWLLRIEILWAVN